ncbi:hypothetical protein [Nocardia wallacei]|uniref:hypothetical protein n=1 Tax=Nocardia wallacei TaxID=480035 RepID=UPI0024570A8D|nr:hypothetical protein [Nocardia wallacei]
MTFLGRSPDRVAHVGGTAAWGPHIVLFGLAVAVAVVVMRRHPAGRLLVLAPLGEAAARRLARTVGSIPRRPAAALRLLLAIPALAMLLYGPYRIGVQVLAGLDPNFTANAWGGPGYLGAMACHYLDGALLMAAAAGLLHVLLLPVEDRQRRIADR